MYRVRNWWLLGGAGLALGAVAGVVVLVVSLTGSDYFTHYPDACTLVSRASIDSYAPGNVCMPNPKTMTSDSATYHGRNANWLPPNPAAVDRPVTLFVYLISYTDPNRPSQAKHAYDNKLSSINASNNADAPIRDQGSVSGLGDAAYFVYYTGGPGARLPTGYAAAAILVLVGNVQIGVTYSIYDRNPDAGTPFDVATAQQAVETMAKDVVSQLS